MIKLGVLCLGLLFADPVIYIEGKVISFDDKRVTLQQPHGAVVHVPRSVLKQKVGIKVGAQVVHVPVKPSEFLKLNPPKKKKK